MSEEKKYSISYKGKTLHITAKSHKEAAMLAARKTTTLKGLCWHVSEVNRKYYPYTDALKGIIFRLEYYDYSYKNNCFLGEYGVYQLT